LAVGLNAAARWYGYPNQGAWFLGNGVDENVIVQLGRTAIPGIWRKAGTNEAPTAPVIAAVAPATAANAQASFTVPGYTPYSLTSTTDTLLASGIKLVDGMIVFQAAVALPTPLGAATSYYVKMAPTTGTFTIAAATPAGAAATVDITDTGTGPFAIASTSKVVTALDAGDLFTRVAHGLVVGDALKLFGAGVPGGTTADTKYYVQSVPNANTFTISASRGGGLLTLSSDSSGTVYYSNECFSAASVAASGIIPGTIVRTVPHNLAVNDAVIFTPTPSTGAVPAGITAGVTYYVHSIPSATTFTIKTTMVGTSALSITSTVAAGNFDYEVTKAILTVATDDTFTRTAHNLAVDDKITYSVFGSALTGITAGLIYFVRSSSYDATSNSTRFKLSLSQTGGSLIGITGTVGIESHRLWTINGSPSLTVTALSSWKAGVDGNDCFKLAYNQVTGTVPFSSTLSGTGTAANPYLYLVSGGTTNTLDEFVAFVAADPLVAGLISISASASSSAIFSLLTSGFTFGVTPSNPLYIAISKGVGSSASEGYTSRTVTVYARYWDAGHNGHGYEGPSSAISNTLIIPNTANNDISITVTPAPTAEGGRFGHIRLYMQFGEDADAVYKLVTPSTPVANVTPVVGTTVSVTVGTTTVFGEDDMSADQQRPLPHKFHAFAAEQMFRGGLIAYPDRLYASKVATVDEVAPEGCSLLADDYETISIPGTPAGSQQVTALIATAVDLQVHTRAGFAIINPVDPAQRVYPASTAGAISQSAVTIYEGKSMYYWAADLQLRTLDMARPADFTSTVATSQFAALGALELLREYIDTDAILRQPDRTWVFPDAASQHIWMFAPGLDGSLIGFAFDLMGRGMVGPFSYPKIYASAQMEPGRPEIVFADEAGRLFVWDSSAQMDSAGNSFGSQSAFTAYSTSTPMPDQYAGYGYVDYSGSRYYRAYEAVIETGMLDMGQPGMKKAFQAALWRTIQDSRALVEVTFIDMAGNEEVFVYGDVNDNCNCRASLMLSDSACRVKLKIIGAESKKWAMRDLVLLFSMQGQI
jgi:hypothetical protein